MSDIILSIIIPVYNVEEYLQQCLDTVFSQDLNYCEVIAVNDGSTDNSQNILYDYKLKYPELNILDRENGGSSVARNTGLGLARGKYVYFLDSDDFLLPESIDQMIDFIEKNNLDIAGFNAICSDGKDYFYNNIVVEEISTGKEYAKYLDNIDISLPAIPVWLYLYKRDFLKKNNLLFVEGILSEDVPFTLKCLFFANKVSLLNIPVLYHRLNREGSITSQVNMKHIDSMLFISRSLYAFFRENNCNDVVFFKKIFLTYLNNASKILRIANKPKIVFTKDDAYIMKNCLYDQYMILHYLLLKHNQFDIYEWYLNNNNLILKKNMRRISRIFWSYFHKKYRTLWFQS